jgi:3',5'-nucleoside bisphosphate phosphatase
VIDLHLHTTASDGLLAPDALVSRLISAGIDTFSVTDHDTVAGLAAAASCARAKGLRFLPGIEITAVESGGDVHMLAYGFDPESEKLLAFLRGQREARITRARRMGARLAELNMPIDIEALIGSSAEEGRAVGRPQLARALVAAGHAVSVAEAFELWLGSGRTAYMPRTGATPKEVIELIASVGGVVSLAHPGATKRDDLIPGLAAHGLAALEVWHSDHDETVTARYLALAEALGLLATGGSDFHGDLPDRSARLGRAVMPSGAFDRLIARLPRALRDSQREPLHAPAQEPLPEPQPGAPQSSPRPAPRGEGQG